LAIDALASRKWRHALRGDDIDRFNGRASSQ
jgi:hypothetical protein